MPDYQHQDVILTRQIHTLLYEEGYTIDGARLQMESGGEKVDKVHLQ